MNLRVFWGFRWVKLGVFPRDEEFRETLTDLMDLSVFELIMSKVDAFKVFRWWYLPNSYADIRCRHQRHPVLLIT